MLRNLNPGLQTLRLFGEAVGPWRLLDKDDFYLLGLPDHLIDQVFRVLFVKTAIAHLFEIHVSEQCPKDAYAHLSRGLLRLRPRAVLLSVIHGRSPNAHLIIWEKTRAERFHHLDLDFNHLSSFDRELLQLIQGPTPHKLENLLRLIEGRQMGNAFFKTLHRHMKRLTCKNDDHWNSVVDLVLKIVFLIFVQRKGWLNFDPFYLESRMDYCIGHGLGIVHCFFKPLFARLEGMPVSEPIHLGTLPCLGGGLFQFNEQDLPRIENRWCRDLYRKLVSNYSFSLFEAREGRRVLGIGPEMLGHVFENLLLHRDRKARGVYFTPSHIAEKQVNAAFKAWLGNETGKTAAETAEALQNIRILDPSCGSGTYLVAAFQVLLRRRLQLAPHEERYNGHLYRLKKSIVQGNLFGVDINPMAIRLAEVRLWLNMIQDLEVSSPDQAPSLPNLQHHLRPGDFLCRHRPADGAVLANWSKFALLDKLRNRFPDAPAKQRPLLLKHIHRLEQEMTAYLASEEARLQGQSYREKVGQRDLPGCPATPRPDFPRGEAEARGLHILYSREMEEGGFDMVVGNPPWLSATALTTRQKEQIRAGFALPPGLRLHGQMDLSLYFIPASLQVLKPGGHLGFLLPGKLLQAGYAEGLRAWLRQNCRLDYLFDFGIDQDLLFKADTFPVALGFTLAPAPRDHGLLVEQHGKGIERGYRMHQEDLGGEDRVWILAPPEEQPLLARMARWRRLKSLPYAIQRGIVTNAKQHFVMEEKPRQIAAEHLKPLLRGRDIQTNRVEPGRWIYWPFEEGPDWFEHLEDEERAWLKATGKTRPRARGVDLGYRPRRFGPWMLVWKYLARTWQVALIPSGWIPDQTTYYMNLPSFAEAWPLFCWFNSPMARFWLTHTAERGKDRFFFYYAHTCAGLPVPSLPAMTCPEAGTRVPDDAPSRKEWSISDSDRNHPIQVPSALPGVDPAISNAESPGLARLVPG